MESVKTDMSNQALNSPEIDWNWDTAEYSAEWHEPIVDLLSRYIPRKTRILEVGAGGSHTLGALAARLGCGAFGVEPDLDGIRKTLQLSAAESAEVAMIQGDGFLLPFRSEEFDVVYSLGLVEHFTLKETEDLISEHARVCRRGGLVIVAVPNLLNLPHTVRKWYLGGKYEYAPERGFTPGQLKRLLLSAGIDKIRTDGLNPFWGLGMSPAGWLVVRALRRMGVAKLIEEAKSPAVRAKLGYMSYAIGTKQ